MRFSAIGKGERVSTHGRWEQALRETLDAVVSPLVRDEILAAALKEIGARRVPDDPDAMHEFVAGPLQSALRSGLGEELAESITHEIEACLAPASSSPTARRRDSVRTPPAGPRRTQSRPSMSTERSTRPSAAARSAAPKRSSRPRMSAVTPDVSTPLRAPLDPRAPSSQTFPATRRSADPESFDNDDITPVGSAPPPSSLAPPESFDPPASVLPASSPSRPPGVARDSGQRAVSRGRSSTDYFRGTLEALGSSVAGQPRSAAITKQSVLPMVLVVTRDTQLVERLGRWLERRATVVGVHGVFPLLRDIEDRAGLRTAIVLDCGSPSIRPSALAALADELGSVQVVLWGATRKIEVDIMSVSPRVSTWLSIGDDVSAREVAERCAILVR